MQRRRSRNTLSRHLSSRLHWATRFCYLSPSEHDVILRIHHCCACSFFFGWPPCQRSDMTLVEVSQHAYYYSFIRTIVLFAFLRISCEPDMVLVYFCWINSVWVWVWVWVSSRKCSYSHVHISLAISIGFHIPCMEIPDAIQTYKAHGHFARFGE